MTKRTETQAQRRRRLSGVDLLPEWLSDDERRARLEAMLRAARCGEQVSCGAIAAAVKAGNAVGMAEARERRARDEERGKAIEEVLNTGGYKL